MYKSLIVGTIALACVLACGEDKKGTDIGGADAVIDRGGPVPDTHVPDAAIDHYGAEDLVAADDSSADPGSYEPEDVVSSAEEVTVDLPSDLPSADEGVSWEETLLPEDVPVQDPGGAGTGSCVDIVECLIENSCQTQECYEMCFAVGTPEAQQQLLGMLQCGNQKCGQYGEDKPMQGAYCVYSQCREYAEPCTKTGSYTCMGVVECLQRCRQNDQACAQACFEKASYDALLKILAIAACGEQNCPNMDQTCLMMHCMQQITACTSG